MPCTQAYVAAPPDSWLRLIVAPLAVCHWTVCLSQNDKRESVGFETEAYAIADTMNVSFLMLSQSLHPGLRGGGFLVFQWLGFRVE